MKIIKFIPSSNISKEDKYLIAPKPIKSLIPQWWKSGESEIELDGKTMAGMKACIPFMDIMLSGYALVAPFDIYISETKDGDVKVSWNSPEEWQRFIAERPAILGATIPRPAGHHPNGFVWSSLWGWKTPRGYSVIVTHPFNRHDLPFTTLSGIIDSDKFEAHGNIPFFIKKGFTGIIKEGTPLVQLIPFKRKKWDMVVDTLLIKRVLRKSNALRREKNPKGYKKALWQRKTY